ncbi:MAG: DUF4350 domain-containing protein [Anaerolineales bacterium]|nr:DUF4350 domain-containing protein [Anaerolineales bacterium]
MKPSRDTLLTLGLLLILAVLTVFAALQQTQEIGPPALANDSDEPNGAHALWLWLPRINYFVHDTVQTEYAIPETTALVLLLEPQTPITDAEWEILDKFVENGRTLLLAGEGQYTAQAVRHYNFSLWYANEETPSLAPLLPIFTNPPLTNDSTPSANDSPVPRGATLHAFTYLQPDRPAENEDPLPFIPLVALPEGPVLVTFKQGEGRVFLSADVTPFTNAGLKEPGNPELILNLIGTIPRETHVWFDEWHHGKRLETAVAEISGPTDWLRRTPAGRALLYVAGVIFLGLLLGGRQFGRPVPLAHEITRRAPLEYVTALANLNRRAGNRTALLRHYHSQLKRSLGRRYRLDPALRDSEFLTRLAQYDPTLKIENLRNLLARLTRKNATEAEMVQWAREAAEWIRES